MQTVNLDKDIVLMPVNNFTKREFKGKTPHPFLAYILQNLRDWNENPIQITDSARTIEEHIKIYKNKYRATWLDKIPWDSRHLAIHDTPFLLACDLRAVKYKDRKGTFYKDGITIKDKILMIKRGLGINVGIGVGKNYIHLDVYRDSDTIWYYDK